jgi:hypothetical protein
MLIGVDSCAEYSLTLTRVSEVSCSALQNSSGTKCNSCLYASGLEDGIWFTCREYFAQTFTSADGRRVNDYTLSPDGRTLTMQVTETSPRLSQTITYKQVYRRVS